jgi:hypothetical protein
MDANNAITEKMFDLTLRHSSLQAELRKSQDELSAVRKYVTKLIPHADPASNTNVRLTKLIDILLLQSTTKQQQQLPSIRVRQPKLDNSAPRTMRALDATNAPESSQAEVPLSMSSSTGEDAQVQRAQAELEAHAKSKSKLQRRCWSLERENKKNKETISHWKEKTDDIAKHCERLMFHLKQETAAKAAAQFKAEDMERRVKKKKKMIVAIGKDKKKLEGRMTLLKQGAEILEGQLRSLDARFVQLRSTLDWSVHHSRGELVACSREFVRLSSQIEEYRSKWNRAEDRARQLDYDVKTLRARAPVVKLTEALLQEDDELTIPNQMESARTSEGDSIDEDDSSDDSESGDDDSDDERKKKKKKKKEKKAAAAATATKNKNKKKKSIIKDPTWRYETVSTTGVEERPPPDWGEE